MPLYCTDFIVVSGGFPMQIQQDATSIRIDFQGIRKYFINKGEKELSKKIYSFVTIMFWLFIEKLVKDKTKN